MYAQRFHSEYSYHLSTFANSHEKDIKADNNLNGVPMFSLKLNKIYLSSSILDLASSASMMNEYCRKERNYLVKFFRDFQYSSLLIVVPLHVINCFLIVFYDDNRSIYRSRYDSITFPKK